MDEKSHSLDQDYDDLLECLLLITQILGRPLSRYALVSGLPLVEGKLTPDLFIRAAERINVQATHVKLSLDKLSEATLPALVLLKNKKACLVTHVHSNGIFTILEPASDSEKHEKILSLSELNKDYIGDLILIQPEFQFTERSKVPSKSSQLEWFWSEIRSVWSYYSETVIASFLINLFALAAPLFAMNVYDRVVPNRAIETLWVLAIGVTIVYGFDLLMRMLRSHFIDAAAKKVDLHLSSKIFSQIMNIKMAARPTSIGVLSNTIHSFESFREFITSSTITFLIDVPFALIFILTILFIGGTLAWVPTLIIPLTIVFGFLIQHRITHITEEAHRHSAEKQATLFETLSNIELIKTTFSEGIMQRKWEQLMRLAANINIKLRFYSNLSLAFSVFVQQFTTVAIIIVGVYKISNSELTMGALIACSILGSRAVATVTQTAILLTRYEETATALQSLNKIMQLPTERNKEKTQLYHPPLKGTIEFRHVKFTYPNQATNAIRGISFKIKSGEHIGIIGRIGSGKSTIAKLTLGLYSPNEGSILLDEIDIQQYDPADIRYHIGYVSQDVTLFYGSIHDNIVFGAPYVDSKRVHDVIRLTGIDEIIKYQPEGLDLQVGEGGKFLSGGQRQLISIARALLLDPPILIFDEPSNSMDDRTENKFKAHFSKYVKNKTVILMTHKASMLSLVNRLIIIDSGKIIADGPRDEILKALSERKINVGSS